MHGVASALAEVDALAKLDVSDIDVLICPPATLIHRMAEKLTDHPIAVGGQDCHAAASGAHTGDIAAGMLVDAGATYVILGHSERRANHGERDEDVRVKAQAALDAGLTAVICVGETLAEREASNTLDIITGQLAGSVPDKATAHNLVIAYEPVWAIGTGLTPTVEQIGEVHDFIRAALEKRFGNGVGRSTRLLYGGSVKPGNASEIFAVTNVDGALVGGASLKAADFGQIVQALATA